MQQQGGAVFRMDGRTVAIGAFAVFGTIIFLVTALPYLTFNPPKSADARQLTDLEEAGRRLFYSNGCAYCHTQYLRPQDWTGVASFRTVGRTAQAGDYFYLMAPVLGSERTGPDLSQEGGAHADDWHYAHFYNPRWTSPKSIMPEFSFYYNKGAGGSVDPNTDEVKELVAFVQSLGGNAGVERANRQRALKQKLIDERAKGNEAIIHEWFPTTWRSVRNPMEPTTRSLVHGKQVFTTNCIGCHGLQGNGKGPAAAVLQPAPRNFTDASQQLYFSDGELYDAILFGVDGTAMPAWGDLLTVNDIWDVTNFIRTIPNGGLLRDDLSASMMVSPPDVKPIEATPITTGPTPTVAAGTGQAGGASGGNATPPVTGTTPSPIPTAEATSGAGGGARTTPGPGGTVQPNPNQSTPVAP